MPTQASSGASDGQRRSSRSTTRSSRSPIVYGQRRQPENREPEDGVTTSNIVETAARHVRLTSASTIRPRPVQWLWTDRLPLGDLALTPGRGGVGKSTFHAWLAAGITRGRVPGAHLGTPRAVIIAAAEDSWERTIVPRLMAAGADLELIYRADVISEEGSEITLTLPVDCDALEAEIIRVGAALLSVDPLMSAVDGGLDTHKDRDVRNALEPLVRLADRSGCTVLGNAHFNKSTGSDPLAMIMGSAAFGNVVRAALGFAVDPESENQSCVISQVKNNLGRQDLPSLRYKIEPVVIETEEGSAEVGLLRMMGESDRSVADILRERTDNGEHASDDAEDTLLTILRDGPLLATEVRKQAREAGFSDRTLDRAKAKIGAKSRKTDGRWEWYIPEDRQHRHDVETGDVGDHGDLRRRCGGCGRPTSARAGMCLECEVREIAYHRLGEHAAPGASR